MLNQTEAGKDMKVHSEEIYELLADSCLFQYYIERELKQAGKDCPPTQYSYRDVMTTLIDCIKKHDSFLGETEVL